MRKTAKSLSGQPLPPPPPRGPNLSLRTWLTGQALQGLCANPSESGQLPSRIAGRAREVADAALAALEPPAPREEG